jgi:hypothetical protein
MARKVDKRRTNYFPQKLDADNTKPHAENNKSTSPNSTSLARITYYETIL